MPVARPSEVERSVHKPGADGIHLDVAVKSQEVPLTVNQARLVSAFPQCSGSFMRLIEQTHISAADILHRRRDSTYRSRRDEKMDMIGH
jgi:hypothetical protein